MTKTLLSVDTYFYRWHDSGAFGYVIVLGKIIRVCRKTYLVRWEFGNTQYIKHNAVENVLAGESITDKDLIAAYEKDIAEIYSG